MRDTPKHDLRIAFVVAKYYIFESFEFITIPYHIGLVRVNVEPHTNEFGGVEKLEENAQCYDFSRKGLSESSFALRRPNVHRLLRGVYYVEKHLFLKRLHIVKTSWQYNVLVRNCEHCVNFLLFGQDFSHQIQCLMRTFGRLKSLWIERKEMLMMSRPAIQQQSRKAKK